MTRTSAISFRHISGYTLDCFWEFVRGMFGILEGFPPVLQPQPLLLLASTARAFSTGSVYQYPGLSYHEGICACAWAEVECHYDGDLHAHMGCNDNRRGFFLSLNGRTKPSMKTPKVSLIPPRSCRFLHTLAFLFCLLTCFHEADADLKLPQALEKTILYEGKPKTLQWFPVENFLPEFPMINGSPFWWPDSTGEIFRPLFEKDFIYLAVYRDSMWISGERVVTLGDGDEITVHTDGIAPTLEPVGDVPEHPQLKQARFGRVIFDENNGDFQMLNLDWDSSEFYLFGIPDSDYRQLSRIELRDFIVVFRHTRKVLCFISPKLPQWLLDEYR